MIGFIFECGPQGADKQVCEYLAAHICPQNKFTSKTLDNKPNLLRDAGKVAAQMLKDKCVAVLIVWDLRPAWPGDTPKPCRKKERTQLLQVLDDAGVAQKAPVYLVCIEQELESWLLASDHAISAVLSTDTRPYEVNRVRHPDRVNSPKSEMMKHFDTARGWRYEDRNDAARTLRAADIDLKRLRRSVSFARFEEKLLLHK